MNEGNGRVYDVGQGFGQLWHRGNGILRLIDYVVEHLPAHPAQVLIAHVAVNLIQ
jgi:hypothetical protein